MFEAQQLSKSAQRRKKSDARAIEAWSLRAADGLTLRDAGARLGVSPARVWQLSGRGSRLIRASLIRSHAWFRMEKAE